MSKLACRISDGIAFVEVDDPETRNALSVPLRGEMSERFLDFEVDPDIKCIVISGAGDHFVSGGDVKSFAQKVQKQNKADLRKEFSQRVHNLNRLMITMRRMPQPIIARVQGGAAGAGASLALACDLIICAEEAFFTMAYRHIGVTPDAAATYYLPRAIGIKKALEMTLLGERVSAREALRLGLVNRVVPRAELDEAVAQIAKTIVQGPTKALAASKRLLYQSLDCSFEQQIQNEAEAFAASVTEEEFAAGVTAFAEKRRPNFHESYVNL